MFDTSLTDPAFAPFAIAAIIVILLLLIEMIGFFFGGLSGVLDNMLPDSLVDADIDAGIEADADVNIDSDLGVGLRILDWLYVGRIPTMVILILLVGNFSIAGLLIQQISYSVLGHYLSGWLASLDAIIIAVLFTKLAARLLYPILPKDETTAISGETLVGRSTQIVLGYADVGSPAQAKLTDEHGQTHYIMVEPDPKFIASNVSESQVEPITLSLEDESRAANALPSTPSSFNATDNLIITQRVGERYLVRRV